MILLILLFCKCSALKLEDQIIPQDNNIRINDNNEIQRYEDNLILRKIVNSIIIYLHIFVSNRIVVIDILLKFYSSYRKRGLKIFCIYITILTFYF